MQSSTSSGDSVVASTGEAVKVEIFDPPMCCPTGLCGPAVDPTLLEVHATVLKLKNEYAGRASLERYVLGQQAAKFMQQPEVFRRLKAEGVAVLPLTTVNGRIVKERSYPSYAELRRWLDGDGSSS
ncbi:arsenite efflux transporter metallochaperone ArsD [Anaeromyxobacter sp. PSR-1]|uniref:arsenite efflux transporter metallochaperone ArsD n=1 Tax=Anaeromyxobacter sp. PSR-1 TaxID=1300915 RepID=UPI0005E0C494|nr:arsenite efflux transporter metallochaperone ArsD [Anaeromyxobacter sp. PSR-1]GAO01253.1 arsenical resistance operon trans-acting repressor ArsD [Anaeromyxobacter sp. PSR-1]